MKKGEVAFEVIAVLKNDLPLEDYEKVQKEIDRYGERGLTKIDENTYVRYRTNNQDLAVAGLFYADLNRRHVKCFKQLEVFNYVDDEHLKAV